MKAQKKYLKMSTIISEYTDSPLKITDTIESLGDTKELIFDYSFEGFHITMCDWFDTLVRACQNKGIKKLHVISGDLNFEENYKRHTQNKKYEDIDITVEGKLIFEEKAYNDLVGLINHGYHNFSIDSLNYRNNKENREYVYLYKNGCSREHRLFFFANLTKNGNIKKSIRSWLSRYGKATKANMIHTIENYGCELDISDYMFTFSRNHFLDFDGKTVAKHLNQSRLNPIHFSNTYFSFVTDSVFSEDELFISEKVFQPIQALHPFLYAGSPHSLKKLHELGYETFPEIFNESYDDIIDRKERAYALLHEVNRMCEIPNDELNDMFTNNDIEKKLIHNYERFMDVGQRI